MPSVFHALCLMQRKDMQIQIGLIIHTRTPTIWNEQLCHYHQKPWTTSHIYIYTYTSGIDEREREREREGEREREREID